MAGAGRLNRPSRKTPAKPVDKSYPHRLTFPSDDLGAAVQRLRQDRNMTQAELAKRAGIHKIYLAKIEGGTKVPAIPTLERIAKALGLRLGITFDGGNS